MVPSFVLRTTSPFHFSSMHPRMGPVHPARSFFTPKGTAGVLHSHPCSAMHLRLYIFDVKKKMQSTTNGAKRGWIEEVQYPSAVWRRPKVHLKRCGDALGRMGVERSAKQGEDALRRMGPCGVFAHVPSVQVHVVGMGPLPPLRYEPAVLLAKHHQMPRRWWCIQYTGGVKKK